MPRYRLITHRRSSKFCMPLREQRVLWRSLDAHRDEYALDHRAHVVREKERGGIRGLLGFAKKHGRAAVAVVAGLIGAVGATEGRAATFDTSDHHIVRAETGDSVQGIVQQLDKNGIKMDAKTLQSLNPQLAPDGTLAHGDVIRIAPGGFQNETSAGKMSGFQNTKTMPNPDSNHHVDSAATQHTAPMDAQHIAEARDAKTAETAAKQAALLAEIESTADRELRSDVLAGKLPNAADEDGYRVVQQLGSGNVLLGDSHGRRLVLTPDQATNYLTGKPVTDVKGAFADEYTWSKFGKDALNTVVVPVAFAANPIAGAAILKATGLNAVSKLAGAGLNAADVKLPDVGGAMQDGVVAAADAIGVNFDAKPRTTDDYLAAMEGGQAADILGELPAATIDALQKAEGKDAKRVILNSHLSTVSSSAVALSANGLQRLDGTTPDGSKHLGASVGTANLRANGLRTSTTLTGAGGETAVADGSGEALRAGYGAAQIETSVTDANGRGVLANAGVVGTGTAETANATTDRGLYATANIGATTGTMKLGALDASGRATVGGEGIKAGGVEYNLTHTLSATLDGSRALSEAGVNPQIIDRASVTGSVDNSLAGKSLVTGSVRVGEAVAIGVGPAAAIVSIDTSDSPAKLERERITTNTFLAEIKNHTGDLTSLAAKIQNELIPAMGGREISDERATQILAEAIAKAALVDINITDDSAGVHTRAERQRLVSSFEHQARTSELAQLNPLKGMDDSIIDAAKLFIKHPSETGLAALIAVAERRAMSVSSAADNGAIGAAAAAAVNSPENLRDKSADIAHELAARGMKQKERAPEVVAAAPTLTSDTETVLEDATHTFGAADFPADQALTNVQITALPADGTLTLGGVPVVAGQILTWAEATGGTLVYTPNANATGNDTFTWNGRNAANTPAGANATKTVERQSIPDANQPGTTLTLTEGLVPGGAATVVGKNATIGRTLTFDEAVTLSVLGNGANVTLGLPGGSNATHNITLTGSNTAGNPPAETITIRATNTDGRTQDFSFRVDRSLL